MNSLSINNRRMLLDATSSHIYDSKNNVKGIYRLANSSIELEGWGMRVTAFNHDTSGFASYAISYIYNGKEYCVECYTEGSWRTYIKENNGKAVGYYHYEKKINRFVNTYYSLDKKVYYYNAIDYKNSKKNFPGFPNLKVDKEINSDFLFIQRNCKINTKEVKYYYQECKAGYAAFELDKGIFFGNYDKKEKGIFPGCENGFLSRDDSIGFYHFENYVPIGPFASIIKTKQDTRAVIGTYNAKGVIDGWMLTISSNGKLLLSKMKKGVPEGQTFYVDAKMNMKEFQYSGSITPHLKNTLDFDDEKHSLTIKLK